MCVFLAGGVYTQVAGNAGLIVAHVASPPLTMRVGVCRWSELGRLGSRCGDRECQLAVWLLIRFGTIGGAAAVSNMRSVHVAVQVSPILNIIKVFV